MNVRAALAQARERLRWSENGQELSDTPDLDAEVLLRHVTGMSRTDLFTHPERELAASQVEQFNALLERRARTEPVAYLTGRREFMGIDLSVDARVLIPRPDTETLVERALTLLPGAGEGKRVADVGTGSGAIALSVSWFRPGAWVLGTDVSAPALRVARENLARVKGQGAPGTVVLLQCALLHGVHGQFALIAANLPYIPRAELNELPATVRDYEPWAALDGGGDGLDVYRALLEDMPAHLATGGTLLMECDPRQAATLRRLGKCAIPSGTGRVLKDHTGRGRVVEITR